MAYVSLATGILLAAGQGNRFDPTGARNKLLAHLPQGAQVAHEAARRLLLVVPRVLAVVRPGTEPLAHVLREAGCEVVVAPLATRGMGASLAAAIRASPDASGWIIALADMPCIAPASIAAVAQALDHGATLVAPFYRGQRGHPVGVGAPYREELTALDGDRGARTLFERREIQRLELDDSGIVRDIDTPDDLHQF
ncbi:nucleotidyltransferase family protein [Paraburkholderia hayleyella]|uniref:nucleotidyltransferase family protein n=1 Tax=Paraburkholderia hayleyella TaxID=2152889 RepID=UPI0012924ECA|nr:nucleotidyltransferase family protein [Paraburkholderia hayleyella]